MNIRQRLFALSELTPPHDDVYEDKVLRLATAMKENGWVGAPLVKVSSQLLTGSHRYKAAIAAEIKDIPCVDYADIFDMDSDYTVHDAITGAFSDWEWMAELSLLARLRNPELSEQLGVDIEKW